MDESADFVAVFEEDSDWQNPVMNFIGNYQCDRAIAKVESLGADEAVMLMASLAFYGCGRNTADQVGIWRR